MPDHGFEKSFEALSGHKPFPWQQRLYDRFIDKVGGGIPTLAEIPTGIGKTSVIVVWLIARAHEADLPCRLVYVVNRRTVVDQTTAEAEKLRVAVKAGKLPGIKEIAISTLRGQFADNREWSADPARPAIVCGTVDMIGSRLLFEGYRIGFKSRPLHAGFLGQDALLVHDEAHLEPAFQKLIETIQDEQKREREHNGNLPWPGLRVMALSATARNDGDNAQSQGCEPFELTDAEKQPPDVIPNPPTEPIHHVWRRLRAKKTLHLKKADDDGKIAEEIAERALKLRKDDQDNDTNAAVLIFVRTLDDVQKVYGKLTNKKDGVSADHVQQLTGTMRGLERDDLVRNPVFIRFLPESDRPNDVKSAEGTIYLVCTSAGEVGVNLSADHMVCDLSTFDSMAQRLGRVNRFGERHDTRVDVLHPESFDDKSPLDTARQATLDLLRRLDGDASPKAIGDLMDALSDKDRDQAFAPEPTIPRATDILFDAWAMTTVRGNMPGRPPVAPYLHGVAQWEPKRTSVAWREEVEMVTDDLIEREGQDLLQELLADYPLKPHELLSDRTDRIYEGLRDLIAEPKKSVKGEKRQTALERARRNAAANVWLINESNGVAVTSLGELLDDDKKRVIDRVEDSTVLLPPSVGGLSAGMLNAESAHADDVADHWLHQDGQPRRGRVWDDTPPPTYDDNGKAKPMALIRTIDTDPLADERATPDDHAEASSSKRRFWHWYTRPRDAEDATRASAEPVTWDHHTRDVVEKTKQIVHDLNLPDDLQQAVILAAELHDLGKQRELWQRFIGNPNPTDWYAKPGKPAGGPRWRPRPITDYRHEFGSLLDALDPGQPHRARLDTMPGPMRDLVLHLVAAHHGYARPHFPPERAIDPNRPQSEADAAAGETMRRYARLQRQYGRWGLAYLESLLRAADWAASAEPARTEASDTPQEATA